LRVLDGLTAHRDGGESDGGGGGGAPPSNRRWRSVPRKDGASSSALLHDTRLPRLVHAYM